MKSVMLRWTVVCLLFCAVVFAQTTPNIGLALPAINSSNWGTKWNNNATILDGLLSGNANVPGLHLSGNFQVPSQASYSPIGGGLMGYDATTNIFVAGNNSATIRFPYVLGGAPSGCAQWGANYSLTGTGVACGAGSGGITGPGSSTNLFIPQWNGTSGNALVPGVALTTIVNTPGTDAEIPTAKAVRNAISAAGGGNVSTAGGLTIGNVMIGAGGTTIQDSGKALPSGPLADTNSAQTFTGKSIDASEVNSGTLGAARLPNPSASTLGGIQSFAAVTNRFLISISTAGVVTSAQPAFTDISGTIAVGQTALTTTQDILYRNGGALGRLPIVANGSCLGATSGTWASVSCGGAGSSPLTTKGDLFGHSTIDDRIPVGSNGQVLTADSTQTLGVKWAAGGSGTATALSAGILASRPSCSTDGQIYQATDQPLAQQVYHCAASAWTQDGAQDGSGTLQITAGGWGIVPTVVATLSGANTGAKAWTGYNDFSAATGFRPPEKAFGSLPSASANTGKVFIVTNASSAGACDGSGALASWCRSDGSSYVPLGGSGGSVTTHWVRAINTVGTVATGSLATTVIPFDTNDAGTTNPALHDPSGAPNNFVADATGKWSGTCQISEADASSSLLVVVKVNGTAISNGGAHSTLSATAGGWANNAPWSFVLTSGDIVTCSVVSSTGFTTSTGQGTHFEMYLIH